MSRLPETPRMTYTRDSRRKIGRLSRRLKQTSRRRTGFLTAITMGQCLCKLQGRRVGQATYTTRPLRMTSTRLEAEDLARRLTTSLPRSLLPARRSLWMPLRRSHLSSARFCQCPRAMNKSSALRLSRLQFRLRSLFVLIAVVAALAAVVSYPAHRDGTKRGPAKHQRLRLLRRWPHL